MRFFIHSFRAFTTERKRKKGNCPRQCSPDQWNFGRYGSGFSDPYPWLTDPDPAPLPKFCWLITFLRYIYIILHRWKVIVPIQWKSRFFLPILLYDGRIRIQDAQKLTIPEQWFAKSYHKLRQGKGHRRDRDDLEKKSCNTFPFTKKC
jgi:hypothetical protein